MKRNATKMLVEWKTDAERKPLILKGARQVGKTWIMKDFGENYYKSYVYFNFDEEEELKSIFTLTIIRETHIKNMYWKPHSLTD